jgi:hypothetical protein
LAFGGSEQPGAAPKGDCLTSSLSGSPDLGILGFGDPDRAVHRTRIIAMRSASARHDAEVYRQRKVFRDICSADLIERLNS